MNITIIAKKFGHSGGSEKYLLQIIHEFHTRGHVVSLLYAMESHRADCSESKLLKHKFCCPILNQYPTKHSQKDEESVYDTLNSSRPDIVFMMDVLNYNIINHLVSKYPLVAIEHHQGLFCLRDSKSFFFSRKICDRKIGVGCFLHGCFVGRTIPAKFKPFRKSIPNAYKRIEAYKKIPRILCISRYMRDLFLSNGFDEKQLSLVFHYVDVPPPKEIISKNDQNIVLFVGRVDRYKGVDYLIKAIPNIKQSMKVVIAGEGSWLKTVKGLAEKLGVSDRVSFLGWCDNQRLDVLYEEATVVIVPSIWNEPFGLVGIEAMSHSKPVIAFDLGGMSDWLEDGKTGVLVKPTTPEKLSLAIDQMLKNKDQIEKFGKAARDSVILKFDKNKYIQTLESYFYQVSDE